MQNRFSLFKERNLLDVFNSGFLFLKSNSELLKYLALIAGPFIMVSAYFSVSVSQYISQELTEVVKQEDLMSLYMNLAQFNDFRWLIFFSVLNTIIISLVVYAYLILFELDKEINFSSIWEFLTTNFIKATTSYLLMMILLISGLILFIVPGIWLMAPLQFYILIRLREKEALLDGVNRSISLMRAYWLESFMLIVIVYIFTSFIDTLLTYPANLMSQSGDYYFIYSYFISLIRGFIQFFLPLVSGLQYYNLRTKKGQLELDNEE